MSATAIVAIVSTIVTALVALAGYVFNERRARADRDSARALADEAHAYDREARRSERRYDARRDTYLDVLRQFLVEVEIADRRANPESSREAPEMPAELEWRDLRARVAAFGSEPVNEAVESFDAKVRAFHAAVDAGEGDLDAPRQEVRTAYEQARGLIRRELESL